MKYTAINELEYFDFHHTYVKDISLSDSQMKWQVEFLKIPVNSTGNPLDKVTYFTGSAEIVFENVNIEKISLPVLRHDHAYEPSEYEPVLKTWQELYRVTNLMKLDDVDCYKIRLTAFPKLSAPSGIYVLEMTFTHSIVTWDKFEKKSCYENDEWVIKTITNE